MMDPLSVIASIAGVATAATQLSIALYTISNRLLNAPKEISEMATELSLICAVARELSGLLERNKKMIKPELYNTTQDIIERVEALRVDIHNIVSGVKEARHGKALRWVFKHPQIKDIYIKINSLKTLLHLAVTTVQVAIEQRKTKRSREAKKKKKLSQDSPNKYRKSAESFVEGCREAIKLLNEQEEYHMLESSKNKLYTDTKLTDPSKETMTWMFHLIFYATLKPDQARKQTGYAQTVRTTDGSVCPSDTEDNKNKKMTIEDKSTISHDMQRHLFVAPDIKGKVLDHLLGSWTELAEEEIVLSRDSDTRTEKEEAELQKSVDSVIKQSISNSQHNEVLSQEGERKAFWDSFQAKGKRRKRKTGGTSISPLPNSGSSKTTPGDVSKFNWKDGGEMDTQAGQAPVQNDKSPVQSLKETEKSKSKVEEAPRSHLTDKKSKPEPKNEATEPKVKDDGELGHDQIWEKYGEIAKREESARRKFLTDKQAKRDAAVKDIVLDHSKGEGEERTAVEDDIWAWSTKPWSNSTPGTTAVQLDDFQTEPQSNNKETTSKPEVEKDNKSSSEQPTFESGPEGWCDGWDETWTVQTTEKRDGPTVAIVTDYNSDDGALPDTSASVATKKSAITSRTTNSVRFQPGDGGSTSEKFLKEKHGNLPKASSISRSDHNSLFSNRTSTEYGSEFQGARDDESRHGMPKIWEHDVKDRRPEDGIAMKQPSNPTDWRAQPITLFDTRPSKVPPINSNNPFGPGLRPNRNGSDPRRSRFTASADHIEKNLPEQSGPFKLPHRPSQTPIVRQNSEDTSTYGGLDESWEGVPYPDEKASKATKIKEKTDRSTPQGRAPNLKGYGMYQPSLKNPYDYSSYGPYRYQSNNPFVSQPGYPPRWTGTSDYGSQYPKGQDNEEKLSKELSLVSSNLGKELSRVVSRMDHYQEQLDEKNFEQMLRKQLEDEMSRAAQERDHKIAELSRKVTELEEQDKIKEERRWEEKREEWEKHRIELQSVMLRAKEIEEQKLAVADITTRATEERLNNRLSDEKEEKLKLHREVETLQAASKALAEDLEKAKADATLAAEQVKAFQERLQQRAQAVPNVFQYSDARTDTESTDNSDGSSTTSEDNESTPNPSVADTSATIEGNIPRSRGSSTIAADPGFHSILFPSQPRWGAIPKEQFESLLHGSGFRSFFQEHLPAISQQVGPYEQQRAGTGGNILSGTMFWEPPGPTAEAELHKALRNGGWRPTYVRATTSGQTWFYGNQPIHVQFFRYQYKPQVEAFNPLTPRFGPAGREEESLIISKGIVEVEELDNLGHIYSDHNGYIFLDARLSYQDIDHIVARSFLSKEGKYRKKYRNLDSFVSPYSSEAFEVGSDAGTIKSATSTEKGSRIRSWLSRSGSQSRIN